MFIDSFNVDGSPASIPNADVRRIWTNPSPDGLFAAQVVTPTGGMDYDIIVITYRGSVSTSYTSASNVLAIESEMAGKTYALSCDCFESGAALWSGYRTVVVGSDGITFGSGLWKSAVGNTGTTDTLCVPIGIYGIRYQWS